MKLILILFVYLISVSSTHAYTLPYPSYMPGHKLYKISRFLDSAKSWWYWGKIGQKKYHSALADKYLIETKTLFEYKQYLLGVEALRRSNEHVSFISSVSTEQVKEHVKILEQLKQTTPKDFLWEPEKQGPTYLPLHNILDESIAIRHE